MPSAITAAATTAQGYMAALHAHPVLVKAVTSGTVYALGDWTAQTTAVSASGVRHAHLHTAQ
jgi:hypothetical protein